MALMALYAAVNKDAALNTLAVFWETGQGIPQNSHLLEGQLAQFEHSLQVSARGLQAAEGHQGQVCLPRR